MKYEDETQTLAHCQEAVTIPKGLFAVEDDLK